MSFTQRQVQIIQEKRPDLRFQPIPTLDDLIIEFLKKYDVNVEPRTVGEWNGWDYFGSIMSIFSEKNSTSDLADNLFYMNRSNQINTAAQEWSTWKRWALDHQEFNSFKDDLGSI